MRHTGPLVVVAPPIAVAERGAVLRATQQAGHAVRVGVAVAVPEAEVAIAARVAAEARLGSALIVASARRGRGRVDERDGREGRVR